jgi:magnesium and cobalt transporter
MRDDKPPSPHTPHKSWISRLSQFLTGEIQDQDELLELLKDAQEKQLLDSEALSMIEGVLAVAQTRVRDIMIPRVQMVVVPCEAKLDEVLPLVIEYAHSRFPVIEDDKSKVIGVLIAKDLLPHLFDRKKLTVKDIMRPANIVPESKRLNVLLKEFRTERNHMAIVVDEYGMAAGLVTIEDVLEQIVGEIADEHDEIAAEDEFISQRNDKEFILKGLTPIEDFNAYFAAHLHDDEFDTLGGFIVHKLEHMPKKGEKLEIGGFRFEILRADSRRIHLIKLKLKTALKTKS